MTSVLTKSQKKTYGPRFYSEIGQSRRITAEVRYDDECGNGHNTFSITGNIDRKQRGKWTEDCGGCIHDEISKHFPELAQYIRWHLVSSDGPMHYIANTVYHAERGALEYARSTAVWPDASLEQLQDKAALAARLPALLTEFRKAIESLGFVY